MKRLERLLREAIDRGDMPGCTYLVMQRGRVVAQGALGDTPAGMDTLYDLASLTKPIMALGMMKLFEEGRYRLDDPASLYVPGMRRPDKEAITIRQLLTHSSGIPGPVQLYRSCHTRQEMMEAVYDLPLRHAPGTFVEYTCQGMMVVGEVFETLAEERMDRYMQRHFFEPMGIKDLLFRPSPDLVPRCAPTENCPWRGHVVRGQVHDENCVVLGEISMNAGLFGTAAAVAAIGELMLGGGVYRGRRYLRRATVELMTMNHTAHLNLARGLAWQLKDREGSPAGDLFSPGTFGHTGFTGTSMYIDPIRSVIFVLLANRIHPTRTNEAFLRTRPIAHNMVILDLEEMEEQARP